MTKPNKRVVLILALWIALLIAAVVAAPVFNRVGISRLCEEPVELAKLVTLAPGMWITSTPVLVLVVMPLGLPVDVVVLMQPFVAAIIWALLLFTASTSGRPRNLKWFWWVISVETLLLLISVATMVPISH